jgi:hypothetical protein
MRLSIILPTFLVLLAVALGDGTAFAKKKRKKGKKKNKAKAGQMYKYPYGMAGCGLGSVVIKSNTMIGQLTASTLNGTGFQTSAISSTGSSNCKKDEAKAALEEQRIFMEANFASLTKEAAQGEGRMLRAFAEVLGCSDHFDEFSAMGQNQYTQIFSSNNTETVLQNYRAAILGRDSLTGSCERARI